MPLDHVNGERIEGLDPVYVVAPFEKYAQQSRLTTIVEVMTGKKFKRKVKRQRPIVEVAMEYAAEAYTKMGLRIGSDVDILVQEYVRVNQVAFLFCARIDGEDYYITPPAVFQLGDEQIKELTVRGLWQPYTVN